MPDNWSTFFTVNFIIVPCLLLLIITNHYILKLGKLQRSIFLSYIFNLLLLHVSLVFTQLIRGETRVMNIISKVFSYTSYFSLISCFVLLYVLCDNIWQSLILYRSSPDVAYDELMQTTHESEKIPRLRCYKILAFTMPFCGTIFAMVTSEFILKSREFAWSSEPVDILTAQFYFIFLPMILLLTFGVIQFSYTGHLIYEMYKKGYEWKTMERIDVERRRLDSINLLRFVIIIFLNSSDSWFIYGFFLFCSSRGASLYHSIY